METRKHNLAIFCAGVLFGSFVIQLEEFGLFKRQFDLGYEMGHKEALKTNPPSDELEIVCAGLWVGEQNKIYTERGIK